MVLEFIALQALGAHHMLEAIAAVVICVVLATAFIVALRQFQRAQTAELSARELSVRMAEREVGVADAARSEAAAADELRLAVDELLSQNQRLLQHERGESQRHLQAAIDTMIGQAKTMLEGERAVGVTQLDASKSLIDQQLASIATRLGDFERTVHEIDGRNAQHLGQLASSVSTLSQTTSHLRDALASQKARGQWGERMAEDVLRLAGFVEGINYHKQRAIASGTIPDFTFLMPGQQQLHMDVKFPLDNYIKCLDAANDIERERYRRVFLSDVRARVKELTVRGYLDERDTTVDCLLMFVPNEQVLGFVQEHDDALLDDALQHRIVICSPLTLFAVLRVVRQSVDNFRLERTANEILELLGQFEQQWDKFGAKLDKLGRSFAGAHKDLDELMTTRTRGLQRPLDKIAALREDRITPGQRLDLDRARSLELPSRSDSGYLSLAEPPTLKLEA